MVTALASVAFSSVVKELLFRTVLEGRRPSRTVLKSSCALVSTHFRPSLS